MKKKARYIFITLFAMLLIPLFLNVTIADDFGGTTSLAPPPAPSAPSPPCESKPCEASCCVSCSSPGNGPGSGPGYGPGNGPGNGPDMPGLFGGDGPNNMTQMSCSSSDAKRIHFYSGAEYYNSVDLKIGSLFPIVIDRSYNNQSTLDTAVGYGWDHPYNQRLYLYSDGSVVVRSNNGNKVRFILAGNNYTSEDDPNITLTQNTDGTFTFSPTKGWQHIFDISGRLVQLSDPNGNGLRFSWSEQRLPLTGRSPSGVNPHVDMIVAYSYQLLRIDEINASGITTGSYVTFNYNDDSGRMTAIADSAGRNLTYHHDDYGNLIRVDLPEGLYLEYTYTDQFDPNNLTAVSKGYGDNSAVQLVERTYDSYDRVNQENDGGGTTSIVYNSSLTKTTVSKVIRNSLTGEELNTLNTVYEFSPGGHLHKVTDDEKQMEYQRDDWNNVTEEVLYTNHGTYDDPILAHYKTVSYRYNDNNNLIQQQILLNSGEVLTEEYTYDSNWLTSYQRTSTKFPDMVHKSIYELNYDSGVPINLAATNRLVSRNGNHEEYISVSYHYDENGNLSSIVYPNGDTVSQQSTNGYPTQTDDFQYTWDNNGNLASIRDTDGNLTRFEYDLAGRTTRVIDALNQETSFTYTGWDLTSVESGIVNDLPGRVTLFTHDDVGRITSSAVDLDGIPVMTETYTYDSEGNILSVTDQLGRKIAYEYNNQNRVVLITEPGGHTTRIAYDIHGYRTSVTDAANHVTSYSYDGLGRLLSTSDAAGGQTSYEYDALSNLINVTDAEGRKFLFGYDLAGRRIWKETPAGGRETYVLDGRDRLIEAIGPEGISTGFQYDAENRLSKAILAKDTPSSTTIQYGYDSKGNVAWYVDTAISQDPVYRMQYDALDRLVSKTLVPIDKTVSYQYTPQGELSELTVSSSSSDLFSYHYQYDNAGRNSQITENPLSTQTAMAYDVTGLLTDITFGNGITGQIGYDERGLLNDLHYRKSDNTTLTRKQYSHNPLKLISSVTDQNGTTIFAYDGLDRLVSADYPISSNLTSESFKYDKTGNRLDLNSSNGEIYDQQGRLLSFGSRSYIYDSRGNLIEKSDGSLSTTFSYDGLNRLTTLRNDNLTARFDYSLFNQRIKHSINDINTWYLYEGPNVLAVFDGTGNILRNYSYHTGTGNLLFIRENDQYYSVATDYIGRPVLANKSNETSVLKVDYSVYGKAIVQDDFDLDEDLFTLPQRFPGQYNDHESELIYNVNRYYDSEIGRYISRDPIGLFGGINAYEYANSNPVNYIDPYGLKCEVPEGGRDGNYITDRTAIYCTISHLQNLERKLGPRKTWVRYASLPVLEDKAFKENWKNTGTTLGGDKTEPYNIVNPCHKRKTDLRWLFMGYHSPHINEQLFLKIPVGVVYNGAAVIINLFNPKGQSLKGSLVNAGVNARSLVEGMLLVIQGKDLGDYLHEMTQCKDAPSFNFSPITSPQWRGGMAGRMY